ncbi:MAG: PD40 domain-containing protein [Armatimonadetes bacterium]|nr:PD40 domain-containing protein [Anaerolineae bacterium]
MKTISLVMTLLLPVFVVQAQTPAPTNIAPPLVEMARYGQGQQLDQKAWSPDGTTLAVSGTRGVWFYEIAKPQQAPEFLALGYSARVAYAPDGRLLAGSDSMTTVLDADRQPLWTYPGGQAVWSRDGALIALYADDAILILDAQTQSVLHTLTLMTRSGFVNLIFSGDNTLLFVEYPTEKSRWSRTAVWELGIDTLTPFETYFSLSLDGLNEEVNSYSIVALAPDGVTLALLKTGGNAYWDTLLLLNSQTKTLTEYPLNDSPWGTAAFSPDGRTIAIANNPRQVTLWDIEAWEPLMTFNDTERPTDGIAFHPDGNRLALDNGVVDLQTRQPILTYAPTERYTVSPDGTTLFEVRDGRLLDALTGAVTARLQGIPASIRSYQFSPDGRWLATSHEDDTAALWQVQTGVQQAQLAQIQPKLRGPAQQEVGMGPTFPVYLRFEFSPDSSLLLITNDGEKPEDRAIVWDVTANQRIMLPAGLLPKYAYDVFTAQNLLIVGEAPRYPYTMGWAPRTGQQTQLRPFEIYESVVSDDGTLAAYVEDAQLVLVELATERVITQIDLPEDYLGVGIPGFSANNTYLRYNFYFYETDPGTEVIWHIPRGELMTSESVTEFWFSARNRDFGLVSDGSQLQLYAADAVVGDAPLGVLPNGSATFTPDGAHLVVSAGDGIVIVWRLP